MEKTFTFLVQLERDEKITKETRTVQADDMEEACELLDLELQDEGYDDWEFLEIDES